MDSSGQNLIVRNNDTITYGWNIGGRGTNTNITIVSTLPLIEGRPEVTWTAIPNQCSSTLSTLSADKRTLTCVIAGDSTNVSQTILPIARVGSYVPNGTQLPTPETTISSQQVPTPVSTNPVTQAQYTVTVSAAPRYDLAKTLPTNVPNPTGQVGSGNNYTARNVPGPDGVTPGVLVSFPIVISAMDSINSDANDELKGLAPLQTPVTFQDVIPDGALLYNADGRWVGALAGSAGGCARVPVANPGSMGDNTNGTCIATQSGNTVNVTIDSSVTPFVTDSSVVSSPLKSSFSTTLSGGKVINSRLSVLQRVLLIWFPQSAIGAGATTFKNTYTNFQAVSVDGQVNTQPAMQLNTGGTDPTGTVDDSVYYTLNGPGTPGAYFNKSFNPNVEGRKGAAYTQSYTDGTTGQTRVSFGNNGGVDLTDVIICEKFDNTTFIVNPNANGQVVTGISGPKGGVGVLGTDYIVEYGTGGVNGVGETWERDSLHHSQQQNLATCADDQSPRWYTSLADVPGGAAAVTKVRVKLLFPLRASVNSYYGVTNMNAVFGWKATATPLVGPNKGVTYDEPVYMDNWATLTAEEFTSRQGNVVDSAGNYWSTGGTTYQQPYNSTGGDEAWLVAAKTGITLTIPTVVEPNGNTMTNVANGTKVAAGSEVTFEVSPSLSLTTATPTQRYPVTVTQTLPAGMTYIAGSASLVPQSVVRNPDGTTTLTWTIPDVLPNTPIPPITFKSTVDGIVPNGNVLNTAANITSPADANLKTSSTSLTVSNPPGVYVSKRVLTPYVAPQGVAQYQLSWYAIGSGSTGNVQFVDVLPYQGDGRTPATTNNPAGLADVPTPPTNDSTMQFYYTAAAPSSINPDPYDASNVAGGSTQWCLQSSFGTPGCPSGLSEVTALRGVSSVASITSGQVYSTVISLQTSLTPKDNDLYTNVFTLRSTGLIYSTSSQQVTARVRLFSIGGTVYHDLSKDGVQQSGEQGLEGVTVTLSGYGFGPDGQDNGGAGDDTAISRTVTTNADGTYLFQNLSAGRYTVTETQPTGFTSTVNAAGNFGGTVNGDAITQIVLNREATTTVATGYNFGEALNFQNPTLKKWVDNCGAAADLSGCPAVRVPSEATSSVPTTAFPQDILRYTIILDNPNSVALPQAIITDNLPANTSFVGAAADLIPATNGTPIISYTPAPYAWQTCTPSSTAVACPVSNPEAVGQINVGWDTDGDVSSMGMTDLVPANSQLRVTFWVRVQ